MYITLAFTSHFTDITSGVIYNAVFLKFYLGTQGQDLLNFFTIFCFQGHFYWGEEEACSVYQFFYRVCYAKMLQGLLCKKVERLPQK